MTCRGCEQTRQLFFHVWRKVKRKKFTALSLTRRKGNHHENRDLVRPLEKSTRGRR